MEKFNVFHCVCLLNSCIHTPLVCVFVYGFADMIFPVLAPPIFKALPCVSNAANDSELN